MNKKILLFISLVLITIFGFPIFQTHAADYSLNAGGLWTYETPSAGVYAIRWHYEFTAFEVGNVEIDLQAIPSLVQTDSYVRAVKESATMWTRTFAYMGVDPANTPPNIVISMESVGSVSAGVWNETDADLLTGIDEIDVWIYLTGAQNPEESYIRSIRNLLPVIVKSYTIPVIFYNLLSVYYISYLNESLVPPTTDPAVPSYLTGYEFSGWKTADGRAFDFESLTYDESMLITDPTYGTYLPLYSAFRDPFGDEYTTPTITPNDPAGLTGIFGALGFGDTEGYMLLFFLATIVIDILLLVLLKISPSIIIIIDLIWSVLWLILGILPLIAFIFLVLIFVGVFISINFTDQGGILNE